MQRGPNTHTFCNQGYCPPSCHCCPPISETGRNGRGQAGGHMHKPILCFQPELTVSLCLMGWPPLPIQMPFQKEASRQPLHYTHPPTPNLLYGKNNTAVPSKTMVKMMDTRCISQMFDACSVKMPIHLAHYISIQLLPGD